MRVMTRQSAQSLVKASPKDVSDFLQLRLRLAFENFKGESSDAVKYTKHRERKPFPRNGTDLLHRIDAKV